MAGVESKVAEAETTAKSATKTETTVERATHRGARADYRWDGVEERPYKEDDRALFKSITRQVLFADSELQGELRYFEVAPGGHTTLERHEHAHAVVVERGRGRCLVGERVYDVAEHDLVHVPPLTWHQFQAGENEPLGFLCMVNATRDRPQLPTTKDLDNLRANPAVAAFIAQRTA